MRMYSRRIASIQSQDYTEDGKVINICWLNFPFVSKLSNMPYFHFINDSEVDSKLKQTHVVTEQEIKTNLDGLLKGWGLDDTLSEKDVLEMLKQYRRNHLDEELYS